MRIILIVGIAAVVCYSGSWFLLGAMDRGGWFSSGLPVIEQFTLIDESAYDATVVNLFPMFWRICMLALVIHYLIMRFNRRSSISSVPVETQSY